MNLKLQSIEKNGIIRVTAEGELTGSTLPVDGSNPLSQVLGDAWSGNRIVLSMEHATYMDSTAIGWLLSTVKEFKNNGGTLVVHSVPSCIQQLFDMLKINAILPIARDEQQALAQAHGAS